MIGRVPYLLRSQGVVPFQAEGVASLACPSPLGAWVRWGGREGHRAGRPSRVGASCPEGMDQVGKEVALNVG